MIQALLQGENVKRLEHLGHSVKLEPCVNP